MKTESTCFSAAQPEALNSPRQYQSPVLTRFGTLAKLTESGVGSATENNNGQGQPQRNPRP